MSYEASLEQKRDAASVYDSARRAGISEGMEKERAKAEAEKLAEKLESALNFKKMGISVEDIAKGLGLTVEQVEKLK